MNLQRYLYTPNIVMKKRLNLLKRKMLRNRMWFSKLTGVERGLVILSPLWSEIGQHHSSSSTYHDAFTFLVSIGEQIYSEYRAVWKDIGWAAGEGRGFLGQ
jgi:hypothetical protein